MGFPAEASRSLSSKDLEPGIQAPSSLAPYLWAALDSSLFCGGVCLDNLHTTVVILSPRATQNKPNFPLHPSLVRSKGEWVPFEGTWLYVFPLHCLLLPTSQSFTARTRLPYQTDLTEWRARPALSTFSLGCSTKPLPTLLRPLGRVWEYRDE